MVLTLAVSLLLIFLNTTIGIGSHYLLEKLFRRFLPADPLSLLLLGLVTSTLYFNLLSLRWPVSYWTLLPLLTANVLVILRLKTPLEKITHQLRENILYLFSGPRLPITCTALTVFLFYWIMPPANPDSWDYHYQNIRFFEKYKIIPGLANIHGRYGYNNVSFLIQAAWAFTDLLGQPIYALNGVLLGGFFTALLTRSFKAQTIAGSLIYALLLCVLCTPLLVNISSPSPDSLAAVCTAWPLLLIVENYIRSTRTKLSDCIIPFCILLYSVTTKLSCFPMVVVVFLALFLLHPQERPFSVIVKLAGLAALIYIPWIIRTYLISGYLLYPSPLPALFHPDWQTPEGINKILLYYLHVEPKKVPGATFSTPPPFMQWIGPWFHTFIGQGTPLDPIFFLIGIFSPLAWIPIAKTQRRFPTALFLIWTIVYAGVWTAFLASPIIRYFAVLLCFTLLIPAFLLFSPSWTTKPANQTHKFQILTPLLLLAAAYYLLSGYRKPTNYPFTLRDCWLYPLKDRIYHLHDSKKELTTFKFKDLGHGVKLYIGDSAHLCTGIDQPCTVTDYGDLEMKGPRLEDGVRIINDKTYLRFPESH